MIHTLLLIEAVLAFSLCLGLASGEPGAGNETKTPGASANSLYDFTVQDIDGNDVKLSKYKGDVLLIVNVASK